MTSMEYSLAMELIDVLIERVDVASERLSTVHQRLQRLESYLPDINKLSSIESINRKLIDEILERLNHDKRNDEQKDSEGREGGQKAYQAQSCAIVPACTCICGCTTC